MSGQRLRPHSRDDLPPRRVPATGSVEDLLRESRRLLATRAYAEVIDRLEVHRPAEWVAPEAADLQLLRLLGHAYLARGDAAAARDCLEQLRAVQAERPLLDRDDLAAALSDLCRCYRLLGQPGLAEELQHQARRLLLRV